MRTTPPLSQDSDPFPFALLRTVGLLSRASTSPQTLTQRTGPDIRIPTRGTDMKRWVATFSVMAAVGFSGCFGGLTGHDAFRVRLQVSNSAITARKVIKIDQYSLLFDETEGYQYPRQFDRTFPVFPNQDQRHTMRLGEMLQLYSSAPPGTVYGEYKWDEYAKTTWNSVAPKSASIKLVFIYDGDPKYYTYSGPVAGITTEATDVDRTYKINDNSCDEDSSDPSDLCASVRITRDINVLVSVDVAAAVGE